MDDFDAQLLAQMREDFLIESQEILDRLGPLLAELEQAPTPERIQTIFREVHTLKGTAGFVGLDSIQRLGHRLEDVFGAVRAGQLPVTTALIDVVMAAWQQLVELRDDVARGGKGEADLERLLARLEAARVLDAASLPATPSIAALELGGPEPDLLEAGPAPTAVPAGGGRRPESAPRSDGTLRSEADTLRVDVETLDTLMTLVGELITTRNALAATAARYGDTALLDQAAALTRLSQQLQSAVTAVRLVPVERLFTRFIPVIRNLARELDKPVQLAIEGADTPLDRTVSEQMFDPLIHLLRNAIDHGIEPALGRRRAGKAPEGLIRLSAERRGDQVVLRVSDDGSGIDAERVRLVAVERELLSPSEAARMPDEQAIRLIFTPGFSTAATVTDLSGRGVGLDVVLEHVRRLRGQLDVETAPGRGTTFVVRLPLTLAILQVLLARVRGYTYALPLHAVRETLQLAPSQVQSLQRGSVTFLRGTALPVRRLAVLLGRAAGDGDAPSLNAPDALEDAVVVHRAGGDEILVVDGLIGKQQIVIKPLSPYLGTVRGVEGAALLEDGSVTLVLDIEGLFEAAAFTAPTASAASAAI